MNKYSSDIFNNMFLALTPVAVIFFLVGAIFFAVAIAYVIRLWLVQTATFQIQQDLADIKDYLIGDNAEELEVRTLVLEENTNVRVRTPRIKLVIKKPRQPFIWIALTIPVLIAVLVVVLINQSS